MIDPIVASSLTTLGQALGGFATFLIILVVPTALLFHNKVIRPLRFVLGIKEDESPTGEAIPSIPKQLAALRQGQIDSHNVQTAQSADIALIKAEVFPNHGSSLRDAVDGGVRKVEKVRVEVVDLREAFDGHLIEARRDHAALQAHLANDHSTLSDDHADLEAHLTRQDEEGK